MLRNLGRFYTKDLCHDEPWVSLIAQLVKNPPSMQETLVQFLGREDLLKG